jgi:hypothetical protein
MAESRAADYIAYGLNRGVDRFLEGMEKRKEEEKRAAREFKSLVDFADSSGLLSKDQAMVMDRDALKGFVQGKMWAKEQEQQEQMSALRQFASMQKMAEFEQAQQRAGAIQGFQTDFNNSMVTDPALGDFYENPEAYQQRPVGDQLAAFQSALQQNPGVDPNDLNTFMSGYDKAVPPAAKTFAPTDDFRMLEEVRKLKAQGRDDDAAKLEMILNKRGTPSRGMKMKLPDGTEISVGGDEGPTVGTQGKLEMDLVNTRKTLDLIDDLSDKLNWKDVGVAGVFGENIMDKLLPQFGVNAMNAKRVDNRTKLKMLIQGAMRQISPDNRFTNEDRKRIEAMMPSTGIFENEQHAKEVLATIQRVFARRNVQDLIAMGKEIKPEELNDAEIGAAVEMGLITYEQARAILEQRPD